MTISRQGFGIEELDRELGGGLLPGTLTVVAGATGIGKTQLGLRWANAGAMAEGSRGIVCDLTSRGDSQNHAAYARAQFGWELHPYPLSTAPSFEHVWDWTRPLGAYFHPIERSGRRREPSGCRPRRLARVEGGAGKDLAVLGRLFLSALRPWREKGRF